VARPRNRFDRTPFEIDIDDLSHDGRGVAHRAAGAAPSHEAPAQARIAADGALAADASSLRGKAVFVADALPGERVRAEPTARNRHYDEARTVEVLRAAPDRVTPRCAHFGTCSGCVLQHLDEGQQILAKQRVLLENLERIGKVAPARVLPPLTDLAWGYRRKGRFSVRKVEKKGRTLVGFRERDPRFVAELSMCHTVIPQVGERIEALAALVDGLDGAHDIPQIEFIAGDATVALVFRHLRPLSPGDQAALSAFAQAHGLVVFLQPGGVESVHPLWPEAPPSLSFRLPDWNVTLAFQPLDFIQVNAGLNLKMIARTLELLDPQPHERVLDLFCGLGNFTLPLARHAAEVVGVEGDAGLVARARDNALGNGLDNAQFHAADLTQDQRGTPWMRQGFDKLLLDPPRSGAIEVLKQLPLRRFARVVYVSCHPGSLARDAGHLVNEAGFRLAAAGVMDMFPHTAHVESIALFERG